MSETTDQTAQLKREGTMAVTAQEGKEFLEAQGMPLTDDNVKTRGQKETLEQITAESNGDATNGDEPSSNGDKDKQEEETMESSNENGDTSEKPKLARDSTMAVTANEGAQLLGGEELEKTRGQTALAKAEEAEEEDEDSDVAKLKRTTTVAQTTEDSQYILGNEEYGKTRSQTRKFSESEEKKPAVKRTSTMAQTAKEGEEFLARETKRSKDDANDEDEEKETETVEA